MAAPIKTIHVRRTVPAPLAPSRRLTARTVAAGATAATAEKSIEVQICRTPAAPAARTALACTPAPGCDATDQFPGNTVSAAPSPDCAARLAAEAERSRSYEAPFHSSRNAVTPKPAPAPA